MNTNSFIKKATLLHGNQFLYDECTYVNNHTPVKIKCNACDAYFQVTPSSHTGTVKRPSKGGCPTCRYAASSDTLSLGGTAFIERSQEKYPNEFSYPNVEYVNQRTPVLLRCNRCHTDFRVSPSSHLRDDGRGGCPTCRYELTTYQRKTTEEWVDSMIHLRGEDGYDYSQVIYNGAFVPITIGCPKCNNWFSQTPDNHRAGKNCKCWNGSISRGETEVFDFIMRHNTASRNDRSIIAPQEIDIVAHDAKLGVEYCGLYWHSENRVGKNYHHDKMIASQNAGYSLITLFEDEWDNKSEIVKSVILSRLGLSPHGVGARKLTINRVDNRTAGNFIDQHHLIGKPRGSKLNYTAYDGDTMVACMTFGNPTRQSSHEWELTRFCTDGKSYPGIASRLFKKFIIETSPQSVVSFSDNRFYSGDVYKKLNFAYDGDVPPDYYYVKHKRRFHKSTKRKSRLIKELDNQTASCNMSELEMSKHLGYHRIYDCGKRRWIWRTP